MSTMNAKGRNEGKAIDGPFVPLLLSTIQTPAWKAMAHGARSLYVALKAKLDLKQPWKNNGRLFVSQRDASEQIGSHTDYVTRWYRELEHYGFIVKTAAGNLGVDGKGKAPHYRLTECGTRNPDGTFEPPTRDFLRWDCTKFKWRPDCIQKQNPVPQKRDTPSRKSGTPLSRKSGTPEAESVP